MTLKKFKCRTFSTDTITFDYGKEHILITTKWDNGNQLSMCLNDKDINVLIKYLTELKLKK
jgi:hypothetical protein